MYRTIFDDLYKLNKEFNRLFNTNPNQRGYSYFPEVNIYENQDEYVLVGRIPGVDKNDLNISFKDNSIKIEGEKKAPVNEEASYHLKERRYGKFERNFSLHDKIDVEKTVAEVKNGILIVNIPKSPDSQPKTITIK
ncbi:MAG: hypothetical protein A2Y34_03245 [Spirochaetes bacterium GWC1_27_15]|nr:MAG: hypothetical protein A2Z98_01140 [Spirochaetes bacterium GWB1_27_13]OHD20105.1 MAG: hypothetical protein A2Y34_03245 [Spirochaetes bacterium GWC1_27_15]